MVRSCQTAPCPDSAAFVVSLLLWPPASSGRRLPEFRTDWYPSSARAATQMPNRRACPRSSAIANFLQRSEEHTSELQSPMYLVCRLLLEKKTATTNRHALP